MSLGFLTESALLPSKAKEIKVDSKSLVDLKAVVFQKEQERRDRQRKLADALAGDDAGSSNGTDGMARLGKYARLKGRKRVIGLTDDEKVLGSAKNRGVAKRSKRDEAAKELNVEDDADDAALQKKSREMLARKAKLYEDMMRGREIDAASMGAGRNGGGSTVLQSEFLVNFEQKRRWEGMDDGDDGPPAAESRGDGKLIEVTDEFGRTRAIAKGSEEHMEYLQLQQQKCDLSCGSGPHAPAARAQTTNDAHDAIDAHGSRINHQVRGSFVVSQWETMLKAPEKAFLKEVQADAQHARQSSVLLDKQRRKQLRLQKLKQQQQQQQQQQQEGQQIQADTRGGSENSAASKQATEFLSALM